MVSYLALKQRTVMSEHNSEPLDVFDFLFDRNGMIVAYEMRGKKIPPTSSLLRFASLAVGEEQLEARNRVVNELAPMLFSCERHLIGAKVYSESGFYLGKVEDVELETEHNRMATLLAAKHFLEKILRTPLRIAISQVVVFERGKVIVQDTFLKEFELTGQKLAA